MEAVGKVYATAATAGQVNIRRPNAMDGKAVHALIAQCPPLDGNSLYCNLLQCTHFAETCAVAEQQGRILGFVSAYIVPAPLSETLFIWQVAVRAVARGRGLGERMIREILTRDACMDVDQIETTVAPDNAPSWALFERVAAQLGANMRRQVLFERDLHFGGGHDSEVKCTIGPITRDQSSRKQLRRFAC